MRAEGIGMPARPEDTWRHRPRHALHRRGHAGANASLAAVSVAGSSASVAVADAPWLSLVCQSLAGQQTELALLLFSVLLCLVAWLFATRRQSEPPGLALAGLAPAVTPAELAAYRRLRNRYLLAYSLATFGDWIQGGYLYALYAQHGYSMRHIALLFVVGYASAATVGTYSSAVGDVGGHRRNCVAYGLIYSVSCLLANSPDVGALVVSRLLGGVAYSILFTSFESWLVADAEASGLPPSLLTSLFATSSFVYASSAVAAGISGHACVVLMGSTRADAALTAPFNLAVPAMLVASALCQWTWDERYGDRGSSASASLRRSCRAVAASRTLLCLGLVNAMYETALYVFVFMWTPSLEARAVGHIPHGLVFSAFMLSKMAGAQLFAALADAISPTACLGFVFGGSALCMTVPIFSDSYEAVLLSFTLFEGLLGIYWPAIALLRVDEISDAERASTMAVFRMLLNALVIAVLLAAGRMPEPAVYAVAAAMLLICLGASRVLARPSDARAGARRARELLPIIPAGSSEAAKECTSTETLPEEVGRSKADGLLQRGALPS